MLIIKLIGAEIPLSYFRILVLWWCGSLSRPTGTLECNIVDVINNQFLWEFATLWSRRLTKSLHHLVTVINRCNFYADYTHCNFFLQVLAIRPLHVHRQTHVLVSCCEYADMTQSSPVYQQKLLLKIVRAITYVLLKCRWSDGSVPCNVVKVIIAHPCKKQNKINFFFFFFSFAFFTNSCILCAQITPKHALQFFFYKIVCL